jgi:thymidylate kinase
MVFVVLEGFSGTGKTTLAKALERRGWLRLEESAHAVPKDVPVADRADTFADYSLVGATMVYSSQISKLRHRRNIVSEGYLLSDLTYAKIRYELRKSAAYPAMMALCKKILSDPVMRPDLYIVLQAKADTIDSRQQSKSKRERNDAEFFRTRYYSALAEVHDEIQQNNIERIDSDATTKTTLGRIMKVLDSRRLLGRRQ